MSGYDLSAERLWLRPRRSIIYKTLCTLSSVYLFYIYSYLKYPKQFVDLNKLSKIDKILFCVTPGSIFLSILFNIFNDFFFI